MKLRRKKSTITTIEVPQEAPDKKTGYARKLYYLFLISLVSYLGFYLINQNVVLKGRGIVVFDTLELQSPEDGIVHYAKNAYEGAKLEKGDTVFSVNVQKKASLAMQEAELKQKYKIKQDINRVESLLKINMIKREFLEKSIDKNTNLKLLEIYQDGYEQKELSDRLKLSELKEEYKTMKDELAYLKKLRHNLDNVSDTYYSIHKVVESYDYVYEQRSKEGDVVKKGDIVAIMQNFDNVYIVGYFEQSKLGNIQEGDILDVAFPDKTESQGRIKSITTNNKEMSLYSDDLIKDNLMLKVIVEPMDKEVLERWRKYNRMSVKLRKNRWL